MPNPVWPPTLPVTFDGDYRETPPVTSIVTNMDGGPPKVRRRFTAGIRVYEGTMLMNFTEVGVLDTFYNDTLLGGSSKFEMLNPRDQTGPKVVCQFAKEPVYNNQGPTLFSVQLTLNILPEPPTT